MNSVGLNCRSGLNLLCGVILSCATVLADSPTVYVGDRYQHRIAAITTDSTGNTYVTGSRIIPYPTQPGSNLLGREEQSEVFVAKLDTRTNERLWIQYFSGKESEAGTAIALDQDGSIYVAGSTSSPNFPLLNPLRMELSDRYPTSVGFILKLSNDGSRLLWSTYYGQSRTDISSVAAAPGGTVILGGSIVLDSFGNSRSFVTKIDPAARHVVWEHYYTGLQLACSGGSSCFVSARLTTTTLAIDSIGNIYAAGNTNTLDLPTTPGAFRERGYGPYIRKLSPAGEIIWSTYLSDNRV
ncbi:MAG: SBBP repeat-containing protein, partial [Bryobacteraceae bacterium]|nr:SBBP repeat-containing protein [Bryobacteraceae bacterium]